MANRSHVGPQVAQRVHQLRAGHRAPVRAVVHGEMGGQGHVGMIMQQMVSKILIDCTLALELNYLCSDVDSKL